MANAAQVGQRARQADLQGHALWQLGAQQEGRGHGAGDADEGQHGQHQDQPVGHLGQPGDHFCQLEAKQRP